jgi:hypothetical protein
LLCVSGACLDAGACESLRELIPLRLFDLVTTAARSLGIGTALVRLIDDDQVPLLLPYPLAHIILLGIVERDDDLGLALPEIQKLLLVVPGVNNLKALAEKPQEYSSCH